MVFSSVPPNFLDHHNWHHQLQQQQPGHQQGPGGGGGDGSSQLPPPPPPPPGGIGGGGEGSIRPGSMVDRARLAKLPLPEPGLNCPRCDSTNTKFCYFNNYSLTQPRHFCKTCRRYWTRGGALRNVPVGGGCRRNKRSKSRSSKSPSTNERSGSQTGPKSTASPSSCSTEMNSHFTQSLQLPFMGTALQSLSHQFGSGGGTISSNLGGFQAQNEMGFQLGSGNSNILSVGGGSESWRLPFLSGFEVPSNLFQYNPSDQGVEGGAVAGGDQIRPSSGVNTEEAPVKVEEARGGGLNLSRQLMGSSSENNGSHSSQQWVGNSSWTEFSGLNSSSTTHFI